MKTTLSPHGIDAFLAPSAPCSTSWNISTCRATTAAGVRVSHLTIAVLIRLAVVTTAVLSAPYAVAGAPNTPPFVAKFDEKANNSWPAIPDETIQQVYIILHKATIDLNPFDRNAGGAVQFVFDLILASALVGMYLILRNELSPRGPIPPTPDSSQKSANKPKGPHPPIYYSTKTSRQLIHA